MGYTTNFRGQFKLNKRLAPKRLAYLQKFAETRRMARNLPEVYGVQGEFYADGSGDFGQGHESNVIDHNRPPSTQPGLWCQWIPTNDGMAIGWDGGEKFYHYVEWLEYIIKNFLAPKGYVLNGTVSYQGDDSSDQGQIVVINNVVTRQVGGLRNLGGI